MALKALMLRKRLDDARKALAALRENDAALERRETELAAAIGEASTEEERAAVEEAVDAFEADKKKQGDAVAELEEQIRKLEKELADEEAAQDTEAPAAPEEAPAADENRERKGFVTMDNRERIFGASAQERAALFAREEVKNWIGQIRAIMRRDVTNGHLLVPQVMLPYLRQLIEESSKLLKHTNLQRIAGDGRQVIDGGFPEAVWTEMCGKLNELSIGFYDVVVGGYKVGGFVSLHNSELEDSDIALGAEVLTKLGRGIGLALDKAIVYGTGTKMPLGIIPRLLQTSEPENYRATNRPWVDLHTTNVTKISVANTSGIKLFQGIVAAFGAAKNNFANGARFWVMNAATLNKLTVEAMSVNAAGAIVAGMNDTMPVIGGRVETLEFMPDNVILGGYDGLYLTAERAGLKTGESEHYMFVDDKTVFKATARYDGLPVIAEGFVAIGISNTDVAGDAVDFTVDSANSVQGIFLNTATASVAAGSKIQLLATTYPGKGTVTWASGTEAKATVNDAGEVTGVAAGSSVITATCNGKTAQCTVTVTGA